jgi:hypothetical protein
MLLARFFCNLICIYYSTVLCYRYQVSVLCSTKRYYTIQIRYDETQSTVQLVFGRNLADIESYDIWPFLRRIQSPRGPVLRRFLTFGSREQSYFSISARFCPNLDKNGKDYSSSDRGNSSLTAVSYGSVPSRTAASKTRVEYSTWVREIVVSLLSTRR